MRVLLVSLWLLANLRSGPVTAQALFTLKNAQFEVSVDDKGNLIRLTNGRTGHNYAGGQPLWRLHYDRGARKDNEVRAGDNQPVVSREGERLVIRYDRLRHPIETVAVGLTLTVELTPDEVRFRAELTNQEPHLIVRELQYPLVANCQLPADHQLITSWWGGQRYADPKAQIRRANAQFAPYYTPSQYFLQLDQKYPYGLAANCFTFAGATQGLYFGSHDATFQDTGHGLRLYPSRKFQFDQLEAGFYKYPHCRTGQTWRSETYAVAPYSGTWHRAAKLYRRWADTWWQHRTEPDWVRRMKGWQRIIMRHQYGETLFTYQDLGSRVKRVGESVGLSAVLTHGWHNGGHDNDYPNYVSDPRQGGDDSLRRAIARFQAGGGAVLFYYSGRLMDKNSDYYKTGPGKQICVRDNTGAEINDAYRFRGPGTFTGTFDSRTFAMADFRQPLWRAELRKMADQTIALGARSVFYDQLGWAFAPNWDLSGEYPVPHTRTIADKADGLRELKTYLLGKSPDTALGIELLTDVTAQHADYVHSRYGATDVLNGDWEARGEKPRSENFIDWFRYTFPEIILSDRDIRDDTDIERRVNHTVLKGLRNDVEIYRCRALIDDTPHYQAYLTQISALKDQYADLLLLGTYVDTEGIAHTNADIDARGFVQKNRMAVVLTQSHRPSAQTRLTLPAGYRYERFGSVGNVEVQPAGNDLTVTLGKHGLAVVVLTQSSPKPTGSRPSDKKAKPLN